MMSLVIIVYCIVVALLTVYGINCHVLLFLFKRRAAECPKEDQRLLEQFYRERDIQDVPFVTTQIPIYNEINVAERIIDTVAAFDYPEGKHDIQVLDDSTDETSQVIACKVKTLRAAGVRIEHIRRGTREGFKAGALKYGLETARGDLLAVFDADFVPPPDFLRKAVPFFVLDPKLGLIQGRWGHLNRNQNIMTRLQAIGIDGHFMIEQSARSWNNLFMNFNGTAGVFRKQAILDVGSWKADTLTEDLDLSYRMQLAGWRCRYLIDLVAPAEIPANIYAFKSQQFRWAKGSMQTAIKLLPAIWRSQFSHFKKLQATLHLTHYIVHPLMVFVAVIVPTLLINRRFTLSPLLLLLFGGLLGLSFFGPSRLYLTAQKYLQEGWPKRVLLLPLLMCFGCGLAINNTRAVLEAILGKKSEFIRTPKQGDGKRKSYKPIMTPFFLFEIALGLWCLSGMVLYLTASNYLIGYFLLLYAMGFLYVGALSLLYWVKDLR
jgi:cellulose synthase/poly-beta-1,6-N-acetylglucosamine synthase-like glycosyltransferase